MSDDEANDDDVTEGGEAVHPRQDLARAVHQALDAIDGAIEKTRATNVVFLGDFLHGRATSLGRAH